MLGFHTQKKTFLWTSVVGSNKKQCLLIKTTHAVVYMYSSSYCERKVDSISMGKAQISGTKGRGSPKLGGQGPLRAATGYCWLYSMFAVFCVLYVV